MLTKVPSIGIGLRLVAGLLLLLPILAATLPASAQEGMEMQMEVIASGLNNPRGLAFGPEGALYVAEAGTGGPDCIDDMGICIGATGSITRIWNGDQSRVTTGLFSLADPSGFGATGPVDISFRGRGGGFIVVGLGADPALRDELAANFFPGFANFGQLIHMPVSGKWRNIADISAFEGLANPDSGLVDSNPYAVAALAGKRVVVDAGGNSLLKVTPKNDISTLAVFPPHMWVVPPEGLPFPGGPPPGTIIPIDSVPTSVVQGPDGALYVGELASITTGEANVWRVPAGGGTPEVYASGFTAIIDIAFAPDGSLYVLEIFKNGLLASEVVGDMTGRLVHVMLDGSQLEMSEGLVAPGGLAVGPDGSLYVTNYSIFPGAGEVVHIMHPGEHDELGAVPGLQVATGPMSMPKFSPLHVDVERLNEMALDNSVFLPVLPR